MTLEQAAKSLREELSNAPWVTMIGVGADRGRECIFVYVKSVDQKYVAFLEDGWHGFPVVIRKMGLPRLVSQEP